MHSSGTVPSDALFCFLFFCVEKHFLCSLKLSISDESDVAFSLVWHKGNEKNNWFSSVRMGGLREREKKIIMGL